MRYIILYEEFVHRNFQDLFPGVKKKWERLSFEQAIDLRYELFEIIDKAYRAVFPEGHSRLKSVSDLPENKDLVFWQAADIDDDPKADVVIFGSERFIEGTSIGYKISGWGHDGSKESKKFLIEQLASLLKDENEYVFIECAGAPAQILTHHNFNIPVVESEKVEMIFPDSEFEWLDNGFYVRTMPDGTKTDKEILIGNPRI
jgi:hypothetical protein